MTRSQVQQAAVILLLLIFIGVWTLTRRGALPGAAVSTPAASSRPAAPEPPPRLEEERPPAGEPAFVRDIFQLPSLLFQRIREREAELRRAQEPPPPEPVIQEPVVLPEWELQGIFWGGAQPQALINRKILSVGDKIEEAEVVSITKERVVLSFHGQEVILEPKH